MKKNIILSLAAGAALTASASAVHNIYGTEFRVDTLQHYYMGPGVTHSHLSYTSGGRVFHVYAVTYDKNDRTLLGDAAESPVEIKVVLGNDSLNTRETVSAMAKRNTNDHTQILAGVNGDFFCMRGDGSNGDGINGYPNAACVIGGKLANTDLLDYNSRENAFMVGPDGMWIDATDFRYIVSSEDGTKTVNAWAVNMPRGFIGWTIDQVDTDRLVVYNSHVGKFTKTMAGGREIAAELAEGETWAMNKPMKFVVKGDWHTGGNLAVPANGIVISCGKDFKNDFIDGLKAGDVIMHTTELSLPAFGGLKPDVREMVGGDVRILKEGVVTTEAIRWINSPGALYSRSLAGYSQDRSKAVFAVVDHPGYSSGVSYYEAADVMRSLGCYDALDLDGGGSTTFYTEAFGTTNVPRDGSERTIANAVYVAINAPDDRTVASIRFADPHVLLPLYGSYTPVIYGYNKYGRLVDTNVKGFTLEAAPALGTIIDGVTLEAAGTGMHALKAVLGDMSADIAVKVVNDMPTELRLTDVLIDGYRSWPIELQSLVGTEYLKVAPAAFSWSVSDAAIATVDDRGVVSGLENGSVTVTGRRDESELTLRLTVEKPVSRRMPLTESTDASEWSALKSGVSVATISALATGGLGVDFTVSNARAPRVVLSRKQQVWSLPDALEVDLTTGAHTIKAFKMTVEPANGREVVMNYGAVAASADKQTVVFDLSEYFDTNDIAIYPITFKTMTIEPGDGRGDYHIDINRLEAVYNNAPVDGVEDIAVDADAGVLNIRIENGMIIADEAVAAMTVYDLSGRVVSQAYGNTVAAPAHRGIYLVGAVTATGRLNTQKIIL